ncbi:MAG: ATP-binding cassette domain-containing protein [Chitinivibrionales bacterium]|nr:ATP-binding cassette domain-containing protein [Chitinivibrionales bacterium]
MPLINLQNISIAFGGPGILDSVSLQIERGERVCLLGVNGTGKSTLLRICAQELIPDNGEVVFESGVRVAFLPQKVPADEPGSIREVVGRGVGNDGADHALGIDRAISQMSLDGAADFNKLSGGQKRRVFLARALANEPELLLLDEPTNHLDIDSIMFLENFLSRFTGTVLFVTHDRSFIMRMATRIVELDRGILRNWNCGYEQYLERKEALLDAEEKQNAHFDKKLAQEEAWIRRGIKARRTRNEGRVRTLLNMREERRRRRERTGDVKMMLQEAEKTGKLVVDARNVTFAYDTQTILSNVTLTIQRGDRIGIMGANGSGKTTLINILLGAILPHEGTVRMGVRPQIAYFDQLRDQLDENKTVWENVCDDGDTVMINGRRRHIIGYLEDFLFAPERAKSPITSLSGGERNRLLLAKLFTKPSNVLVFDEPTNDLDITTLELLEELLLEYSGTILLVSHDRTFLNNVVTCTLAIENDGSVKEYVGGFDQWHAVRQEKARQTKSRAPKEDSSHARRAAVPKKRKLSYKQTRSLEVLPAEIEQMELECEQINADMAKPEVYQKEGEILRLKQRLADLAEALARKYDTWESLEQIAREVAE